MNLRASAILGGAITLGLALTGGASAWPPDFFTESVGGTWNRPVGVTFGPGSSENARIYVWDKGGRVWMVENGVRLPQPLINISEEVGNWRDFGLLGFALDPHFSDNGYIYLLYTVDYHHLAHFGTPEYDPAVNEYFHDTIGRLTRYTCNAADGFRSVLPGSRRVLIGESMSTGFPVCHQSHGIGSLAFGQDGTLLVSCGDGASYDVADTGGPIAGSSNTALQDGIIRQAEDVGALRAQLVNCHSGKLLRIDPATGDGVASNPFYDASNPRAPKSRVWAMGFRNPFRINMRPGTGSDNPAAGDPGTVYVGDVGWFSWEELNVVKTGGKNFGWPIFEGYLPMNSYAMQNIANRDARNPLYTPPPGGCTQEFFYFRNLIIQDTLNPNPSFPNPCNPGVQIPASINRFVHTRPAIDWGHGGVSRCGGYIGNTAIVYDLGAAGAPVDGPQFGGACSVGGVWCPGTNYPAEYRDTYFQGDFAAGWIRQVIFDAQDNPVEVRDFTEEAGPIVAMAADPVSGDLYYIAYDDSGNALLQHVRYAANVAPTVAASATPYYGPAPLSVQFSSAGSSDPEGPITYSWDFGDGSAPSTEANPVHMYDDVLDITDQGTFTALVFSMDPPMPQGGGSLDPEVMRDADFPPVGADDLQRQYDTYHFGQQGSTDWIGYTFGAAHRFHSLVFQEGVHSFDGGWFQLLRVQYRTTSGQWVNVQGMQSTPAYPGNNGVNFETFRLTFAPVFGTGIRISGTPGGSARFISVGELRVFEAGTGQPTRRDATLTVTDNDGASSSATLTASLNNTPPTVRITSPLDGSTYSVCQNTVIPLTAEISDAEHPLDDLTCTWQTILHHNEHTHPEKPVAECSSTTVLTPHGTHGDTFYFEIVLTVSDPAGLSTSVSSIVHASCCPADWNHSGAIDSQDFFDFLAAFFTNNADFNGDGVTTSQDFFDFLTLFFEGCE